VRVGHPLHLRRLGTLPYPQVYDAMRRFTDERTPHSGDELWLVEHPPVFTLGLAGKREHLLAPGDIDVVHSDRGGQVTYHGPGQLVLYPLLDLRRHRLGPRALVTVLERAVIDTLAAWNIIASARADAPGVYVKGRKIASLGLRIRRGCSYHGVALNVGNDLAPFERINPCGLVGMEVTRLADEGGPADPEHAARHLVPEFVRHLGAASGQALQLVDAGATAAPGTGGADEPRHEESPA
jgi:lipoyl(octanoyl) transferase